MESIEERGEGPMRVFLVIIISFCYVFVGNAQSVRSLVNGGNDLYAEKKFTDAEVNYKKAVEKDITLMAGHYNLGNSLYRQNKLDEAMKSYEEAVQKSETKQGQAKANYNLGDAQLKSQKYEEAVKSFTQSLKLRPDDQDAKYNLSYALTKLKEQQQQQKNDKNQDKDKNKDKQDQNKKDQDKQNQDKQDQKKDEQKPEDQKSNEQKQDQQQQPKPQQQLQQDKKMSKADAERILEVLKNNEKDVQKKLRARVTTRPKTDKDW